MKKVVAVLSSVGTALTLGVGRVFAQTPTVYDVPDEANQFLVNIMASIQEAIFSVLALIMPYAIPIMLLFFALGIGYALFQRFRR